MDIYVSVHIFSTHATAVTYIAGRYAVEVVVGAGQAGSGAQSELLNSPLTV